MEEPIQTAIGLGERGPTDDFSIMIRARRKVLGLTQKLVCAQIRTEEAGPSGPALRL